MIHNTFATSFSFAEQVVDWSVNVMEQLGGFGAGLLIALENIFPPLPSEIILPLVGFTASQGSLNIWGAIMWTTLGSVTGALVLYGLGAWLGRDRIRSLIKKVPLVKVSDLDKTEEWFRSHENQTVFWARMVPLVRSLISIPAGIEKMPIKEFIIFTAAGSAIWNSGLIFAGYFLGEQWYIVEVYIGILQYIVVAAIILAVAYFVYKRLKKTKTAKQQ
jgi:membrane protein DedA with SNARE-associated domain